jgi:hypothetical protein
MRQQNNSGQKNCPAQTLNGVRVGLFFAEPTEGHRHMSPRCPDRAGATIAVVYRPIAELKLDPNNPRLHSPRQVRQIARSIQTFGFNVPVLIDARLKVIAGHGRLSACRELG